MNKTYIEHEEITLLENAANNLRDKLLIRILFRLGCRVSEALAIGVEDIGFSSGIIMIKHLKSDRPLFATIVHSSQSNP